MPDFQAYRPDLADPLIALWNDATDGAYPLALPLWWSVTAGDPMFEPGDLIVRMGPHGPIGFVLTKLWRGDYPGCERFAGQGWIALLAVAPQAWRQGVGRSLLAGAHARLRARGVDRVALGGSFHHVMPGVPAAWADARAFFAAMGYAEGQEVWDVRRDLRSGPELPAAPPPAGVTLRPYTPGEEPALEAFLRASFPGRWARDTMQALATGRPIGDVMGAFRDGHPLGFAWTHPPGSEGAWRWAGFEEEMAALGPIGIAETERGSGLGLALLVAGLRALRDRGAGPTVIDWTDLLDFYARAGFAPWLRYVQARRNLP